MKGSVTRKGQSIDALIILARTPRKGLLRRPVYRGVRMLLKTFSK
jgi:hypothetical protein